MRQEFSHISAPGLKSTGLELTGLFSTWHSPSTPSICSQCALPPHMHTLNFSRAAVCGHTLSCSGRQNWTTVFTFSAWDTIACWHLNSDWDVFCKCLFWSQSLNFLYVSAVVLAIVLVMWWVLLCVWFFFLAESWGRCIGLTNGCFAPSSSQKLGNDFQMFPLKRANTPALRLGCRKVSDITKEVFTFS